MKLITKTLIDVGVCDIFEENPKCRIKLDRVDIMLYGKGLKRYDVTKKSCSLLLNFCISIITTIVYFNKDAQVFVPTVSVGLKLLRSIFDVYNYKSENVLPYSEIAEIVGLTYKEFMSTPADEHDLLDYPDVVESVSSTYSEFTLIMNGIIFFEKDSEIVLSVQKSFGMFNPNV